MTSDPGEEIRRLRPRFVLLEIAVPVGVDRPDPLHVTRPLFFPRSTITRSSSLDVQVAPSASRLSRACVRSFPRKVRRRVDESLAFRHGSHFTADNSRQTTTIIIIIIVDHCVKLILISTSRANATMKNHLAAIASRILEGALPLGKCQAYSHSCFRKF